MAAELVMTSIQLPRELLSQLSMITVTTIVTKVLIALLLHKYFSTYQN